MFNEITIVIVTFNPDYYILNQCINSIADDFSIIIVDNASNLNSVKINNYKNKKIKIIKNENTGNGDGINVGVNSCNSKYILYLDVDTRLPKDFVKNIYEYGEKLQDFAVIAPMLENYNYSPSDFKNHENKNSDFFEMNFVEGAIMLINRSKTYSKNIKFDKNIFLYWEEIDFFQQCFKQNQRIYLLKKLIARHEGTKSINSKLYDDILYNRHWHYMWSKFYFYKKNYNIITALKKTIKHLLSALFKSVFFYILRNKKYKIYSERCSGLINSYMGRPSSRRLKIDEKNIK